MITFMPFFMPVTIFGWQCIGCSELVWLEEEKLLDWALADHSDSDLCVLNYSLPSSFGGFY